MNAELQRLRDVYRARDGAAAESTWRDDIYHPRHPFGRLLREHDAACLTDALNRLNLDLAPLRVLDVGCGGGHWLRLLLELGAQPENLAGVDLSEHRIAKARRRNPALRLDVVAGAELPAADASVDLVMQVVVFSSILDPALRDALAREMLRVLRPGGHVMWLDLDARRRSALEGFGPERVRSLFPGTTPVDVRRVQPGYFRRLANTPTVARTLYALSPMGCQAWMIWLRK